MTSVTDDLQPFSQLYTGCQMRVGYLEEFFQHKNQTQRPKLSGGSLRVGKKSRLLACLEDVSDTESEGPATTNIQTQNPVAAKIIDSTVNTKRSSFCNSTKLYTASCLKLACSSQNADSLQAISRTKCGNG